MFKNILNRKKPTIWVLIMVLGFCMIVCGVRYTFNTPDTVATAASKKALPIYCVDTQGKKQIAISFDAAWGEGR
ncbi:MAG: hypothetical protein ACI4VF_04790 [Lachnospirales bacterium]